MGLYLALGTEACKAAGKEVPYTLTDNTTTNVNKALAASCKVVADKAP